MIIRYGIVVFFFFASYCIAENYCTIKNKREQTLKYVTEFLNCLEYEKQSYVMLGFCLVFFLMVLLFQVIRGDRRQQSKFYKQVDEHE